MLPLPPPSRFRPPAEVLEQKSEGVAEDFGAQQEAGSANIKELVMDLRNQAHLNGVLGLSQRRAVLEQNLLEKGLGHIRARGGLGESSRRKQAAVAYKSGLSGATWGNHRSGGGGARDEVRNETLLVSLSLPALSDFVHTFTVAEMDEPVGLSIQTEISGDRPGCCSQSLVCHCVVFCAAVGF